MDKVTSFYTYLRGLGLTPEEIKCSSKSVTIPSKSYYKIADKLRSGLKVIKSGIGKIKIEVGE